MTTPLFPAHTPYLEGAPNFRDIGGYGAAGGQVRHGRVFRSDVLSRLSDADVAKLAALDIRLVFDLRLPKERRKDVTRWPAGQPVETISFDVRPELVDAQATRWQELLAVGELDSQGVREIMFNLYRRMPKALAMDLAMLFARLDAPTPPATLVHCTGGKDRTGFVCAMLLAALDVGRDDILADYLLTGQRLSPERFVAERLAVPGKPLSAGEAEVLRTFATVQEEYLATAFAQIEADFGSVNAYLATLCGLDAERKARLHSALIA